MGIKELTILTCDGFDCDCRVEIEKGDHAYHGITSMHLVFGPDNTTNFLWRGHLCDACRDEMCQRLTSGVPSKPKAS